MKKILTISLIVSLALADSKVIPNGLDTFVDFTNSNYLVSGGVKKGNNLFFSFEKFSIDNGQSLTFKDESITNNISRISSEKSFIDGKLNSNAQNLYLLNPNGIMFGKNAKLNLAGSLHLSTGDYIKFADESILYANPIKSSILSSSAPTSFGFLGDNFAPISITGQGDIKITDDNALREESSKGIILKSGENLNIVAGEILLENGTFFNKQFEQQGKKLFLEQAGEAILDKNGDKIPLLDRKAISNLKVSSGNINLIAVNSDGEVNLNTLENSFNKYGDIKVNDFFINLSESIQGNSNANLGINIIANNFIMDKGSIALVTFKSKLAKANIEAENIKFLNGSNIMGASAGLANGATINLSAKEDIVFSGVNEKIKLPIVTPKDTSIITTLTQGSGDAGDITLKAKNILFSDGANIDSSSFNIGNVGDITLIADENIIFTGENRGRVTSIQAGIRPRPDLTNTGNTGDINLNAKNINFNNGARILASIKGDGNGGKVTLNATESIVFDGFEEIAKEYFENSIYGYNFDKKRYQFSSISTFNEDFTNGSEVLLNAPNITFLNGAFINSTNLSKNAPNSVKVYATNLILDKASAINSASTDSGKGGDIKIEVENLKLTNGSIITSRSQSENNGGYAGTVDISANEFFLRGDSIISTSAEDAGGGGIKINSNKLIYLGNSKITTSVKGGDGNGGNVKIFKPTYSVLNSSELFANAYEGDGGNIDISARDFIESTDSKILASSKFGRDGEINIDAVEVDMSNTLANLPTNFLDISKWKKKSCQKREGVSSFVVEQKDGLPLMIDDYQPILFKAKQ